MAQSKEARPPMILRRTTKHDLPEEIVLEILARLPAKSLLRFRCVRKTWYSNITNPNFISTHLLCKSNFSMAYFRRPHPQICTVALNYTFETMSEFIRKNRNLEEKTMWERENESWRKYWFQLNEWICTISVSKYQNRGLENIPNHTGIVIARVKVSYSTCEHLLL